MSKHDWIPAGSRRAQNIDKLLRERDWCYFIPPQHGQHGFIPACVIENVQGYRMMSGNGEFSLPWYWGNTIEEANSTCEEINNRRGISKERALEIVQSTMADFTREPKLSPANLKAACGRTRLTRNPSSVKTGRVGSQ